jgi:hypothetical protein
MRKMRSTIVNPIYAGGFSKAVNRDAAGILSRKAPKKKSKAQALVHGSSLLMGATRPKSDGLPRRCIWLTARPSKS